MIYFAIVIIASTLSLAPPGALGRSNCVDHRLANPNLLWNVSPSGTIQSTLSGIAGSSDNDIWAVGAESPSRHAEHQLIEHWNGTTWSIADTPKAQLGESNSLDAVTADSPNDAWALGRDSGGVLLEHWDGISWTPTIQPTWGKAFYAISMPIGDPDFVWAVGSRRDSFQHMSFPLVIAQHWNGRAWLETPVPHRREFGWLSDVIALPGRTAWAVGTQYDLFDDAYHTLIEHEVAGKWSEVLAANRQIIYYSVTGTSDRDIWIIGTNFSYNSVIVERWNGSLWSKYFLPHRYPLFAYSIAETSANDVWVGGATYPSSTSMLPYLAHFDGTKWVADIHVPIGDDTGQIFDIFATTNGLWTAGNLTESSSTGSQFNLFTSFANC